ncbi:SAM-dependent methyltransferase [Micromonospora sp. NPDC023814]|uniref:SAM-dependent methyltransferase n=1 Tax=Micromonospora sp. NPDC023814 TaxID=3154596 RepID=UPI0033FF37DB
MRSRWSRGGATTNASTRPPANGSIPTLGTVHEVAQKAAPDARVVYVDVDPVASAAQCDAVGRQPPRRCDPSRSASPG